MNKEQQEFWNELLKEREDLMKCHFIFWKFWFDQKYNCKFDIQRKIQELKEIEEHEK